MFTWTICRTHKMASLISDHRYVQIHWRHCIPCIVHLNDYYSFFTPCLFFCSCMFVYAWSTVVLVNKDRHIRRELWKRCRAQRKLVSAGVYGSKLQGRLPSSVAGARGITPPLKNDVIVYAKFCNLLHFGRKVHGWQCGAECLEKHVPLEMTRGLYATVRICKFTACARNRQC